MTKMMNNYHFYDTSALLEKANYLLTCEENIVTSTTVLEELENIKNNKKETKNITEIKNILERINTFDILARVEKHYFFHYEFLNKHN